MNQLINILQEENNLTLDRLKQLYRTLSKEVHPDRAGGSEVKFIQLKRDYEEALSLVGEKQPFPDLELKPGTTGKKNLRDKVLDQLTMFAIKVFTSAGDVHLRNLIELSRDYQAEVYTQLVLYRELLYSTYPSWINDESVYYPHSLFIAAIKQLLYYRELSHPRYKKSIVTYAEDLKTKYKKLDPKPAAVLLYLMNWLKAEADLFEKRSSPRN